MSISLTRMRYNVRKGLGGLDSNDLNDTDLDELLNKSLWDLEDSYPFEAKETVYTTSLVTDQHEYDLSGISNLDAIVSISYLDENGESQILERMGRSTFDQIFDDGSSNDPSGDPDRYLREGTVLTIWPPPDADLNGQSLRLAVKESVASLAGGADTTGLPRNWDELVEIGAIERGHFLNQDYDLMNKARNYKLSLIRGKVPTKVKEQSDSEFAGLEVIYKRPASTNKGWEPVES